MSEQEPSNSIDRQLRNVALPPGLLPRLREIAAMGDVELDRLIGTVPIPEAALDRLREIGSLSDADIDGELRDVELPRGMRRRIKRSMRWQVQRAQVIGWAVAASLLAIFTGVAYWAGSDRQIVQQTTNPPLAGRSNDFGHAGNGSEHPGNAGPLHFVMPKQRARTDTKAEIADGPARPTRAVPQGDKPSVGVPNGARSSGIAENQLPAPSVSDGADHPTDPLAAPEPASAPQHSIFGGMVAEVPPNLKWVEAPMPRGVAGPAVEGYDLISELRHGRHPFVVPSLRSALRESRVPVWTNTSSYEMACRMTARGELPPAAEIHVEDFLAAMDYDFPPPAGAPLGIRTAAGPAPWGLAGMSLMQIGIQAARLPKISTDDTHLTLVIDASAAMRDSGRSALVRQAILRLIDQMGPRDCMSIVGFQGRADLLVRQADPAELRRVVSTWNDSVWKNSASSDSNHLELGGQADMGAGLQAALKLVQPAAAGGSAPTNPREKLPAKASEKIVLIADSLEPIDERSLPQLRDSVREAIDTGVKWELIGLSQDDTFSPRWEELAELGGHAVRHANTAEELFQRLSETLAGRSQVVAASVEMKVTFDPAAVSRYRLIGHEANSGGALSGAPLQEDLRSGQAATALYEVELKPDGPTEVAFVDVSWRDPVSETPRHLRQPIGRLQFVNSWRECALPLQMAAVAAGMADMLRSTNRSPVSSHLLDQVAKLANEMNPALATRPAVVRLKRLIQQARTAKPARSTADRAGS